MSETLERVESQEPTAAPTSRAWTHLLVASAFEIVFALGTNGSDGFTHFWWSVVTVAGAVAGVYYLGQALRVLDIGLAYAVWTGIGAIGTVTFGALIFGESLTLLKALCFLLIVGGVIGLKFTSAREAAKKA
jgi:quaternary ammonium compound-resistance protein SugE